MPAGGLQHKQEPPSPKEVMCFPKWLRCCQSQEENFPSEPGLERVAAAERLPALQPPRLSRQRLQMSLPAQARHPGAFSRSHRPRTKWGGQNFWWQRQEWDFASKESNALQAVIYLFCRERCKFMLMTAPDGRYFLITLTS